MSAAVLILLMQNPPKVIKSITLDTVFYANSVNFLSSHMQLRCCGKPPLLVGYSFNIASLPSATYRIEYE